MNRIGGSIRNPPHVSVVDILPPIILLLPASANQLSGRIFSPSTTPPFMKNKPILSLARHSPEERQGYCKAGGTGSKHHPAGTWHRRAAHSKHDRKGLLRSRSAFQPRRAALGLWKSLRGVRIAWRHSSLPRMGSGLSCEKLEVDWSALLFNTRCIQVHRRIGRSGNWWQFLAVRMGTRRRWRRIYLRDDRQWSIHQPSQAAPASELCRLLGQAKLKT